MIFLDVSLNAFLILVTARIIKVLRPLHNVEIFEGENAHFEVEISEDDVHPQWKLKGEALLLSPQCEIVEDGKKHILTLYNCKLSDSGEVSFQAANAKSVTMKDEGKVHSITFKDVTIDDTSLIKVEAMDKSSEAKLTVLEGDPYFISKLQDYTAVEKDEVILQCEVSKAAAPVKWFKDGKELIPSKNLQIKTDGKKRILVIKRVLKGDQGQYSCDCGTDNTSAKLNIE
eukprot:g38411.t1